MKRTQLIRLKVNGRKRQQADALRREAGRGWSEMLALHWCVYREKQLWLSKKALQRWAKGRFALHSQTIQALADKLHANFQTAHSLRKNGDPDAKFPYKRKRYQVVIWKGQAIRVRDGRIILPNGRGQEPFAVRCPGHLLGAEFSQAELLYKDGDYWLSVVVEKPKPEEQVAIDLGEIHALTVTDGEKVLVISGREIRSVKRWRNKRIGQLQALQKRCRKGSRRWCKLQEAKNKVKAKAKRRLCDLDHKVTRMAARWLLARGVSEVAVGDLKGIAQGKRFHGKSQQKIGQWGFYRQVQYLQYKFGEHGGKVVIMDERGTSSTCPRCLAKVRPNGRVFKCKCGLKAHRDVIGVIGILGVLRHGEVSKMEVPTDVKYRCPDYYKGRERVVPMAPG